MPTVIKTPFDGTIQEDVQLETIDGKPPAVQTTLANAENIYKSFLYLRKMYSFFPEIEQSLGAFNGNYGDYVQLQLPVGANIIRFKNLSDSDNAFIKINGGEYVLLPHEMEEIAFVANTTDEVNTKIEVKGYVAGLLIKRDINLTVEG